MGEDDLMTEGRERQYTGEVRVGGPADRRELVGLTIEKLAVGPMDNNAYLLRCTATGDGLLIDAANEAGRLIELVADTPLRTVVTTHQHADHWQALPSVIDRTGATAVAHPLDAAELPVDDVETVEHGGTVTVGDCTLSIIHLRGHTPGSIAIRYDEPGGTPHLFTGDSLFPGGPGRTTSPADFTSLMDDLEQRVFGTLPDETWFYPGHGNDSTLGAERASLPEWRSRGW
jgi:glyoxylase-like metal-dependent hydrolase (beta-lactamase superfamily II)